MWLATYADEAPCSPPPAPPLSQEADWLLTGAPRAVTACTARCRGGFKSSCEQGATDSFKRFCAGESCVLTRRKDRQDPQDPQDPQPDPQPDPQDQGWPPRLRSPRSSSWPRSPRRSSSTSGSTTTRTVSRAAALTDALSYLR